MCYLHAPRRGFSATWSLLLVISMQVAPPVRVKTFFAHVELKNGHVVSKSGLFAHER